jgi:hypothetical protein
MRHTQNGTESVNNIRIVQSIFPDDQKPQFEQTSSVSKSVSVSTPEDFITFSRHEIFNSLGHTKLFFWLNAKQSFACVLLTHISYVFSISSFRP